jgi:hypothetical protein
MEAQPQHPEWDKETSMTAPWDRDPEKKSRPETGKPPLTEEETKLAVNELYVSDFQKNFPKYDRRYADPPIHMQNFGLFSFTPTKNSKPDEHGVFGFVKLRGNFHTSQETDEAAETVIRTVDSFHSLYRADVGRPYPVTFNPKFVQEVTEVDLKTMTTRAISSDIKDRKQQELRQVQDMKDREKGLLEDAAIQDEDPYDQYITLKVKKAQLTWTYLEHQNKMDEVKDIIIKTRSELLALDTDFPDFENTYYEKYMEARSDAGIKESDLDSRDNFMKFLIEDPNSKSQLPF